MSLAIEETVPDGRSATGPGGSGTAPEQAVARGDALRQVAAKISGQRGLVEVFEDILDHSATLFGADRAGLWLVQPGDQPFALAAQRNLSSRLVAAVGRIRRDRDTAGWQALKQRRARVLAAPFGRSQTPELARIYRAEGIRTVCFIPIASQEEPLGLLVLYHRTARAWPPDELDMARAFADQMATAIQNARLRESVGTQAARLRSIQELMARLNRAQDVPEIGEAIVTEIAGLLPHDTIRVYVVDVGRDVCEPIAYRGTFLGVEQTQVTPDVLRVQVGQGITGWVAAHGEAVLTGDSAADPRGITFGSQLGTESLLVAPMIHEDRVCGVIALSLEGRDRYTADDLTTLRIFAGSAAQALVNAERLAQLRRQQVELEHQLVSQRRLLEVNERLLSERDPHGVLNLIADSLKILVDYDTLAVYQVDPERKTRRAVIARDRFAELILGQEMPLGAGLTGWAIANGEAVLANDAHLDPRSMLIPGTPQEPESMIIVPLVVGNASVGTLNVGRIGEAEAHFSQSEFELVKLFAGQASLALRNAEAHRAAEARAELDALTGLANHGAFQRDLDALLSASGASLGLLMLDLDAFKAYNDRRGHPAGDALLQAIGAAIAGSIRGERDRAYRYGGDEFAILLPGATRQVAVQVAERIRRAVDAVADEAPGPRVTVSIGIARCPEDGRTKDDLVAAADAALYLAKPIREMADEDGDGESRSSEQAEAIHETALALMTRREPRELLQTILARATALMGVAHGCIYLIEPDGVTLQMRVGIGLFEQMIGYRVPRGTGLAGAVAASGRPFAVDDYDSWPKRVSDIERGMLGSAVGVPLASKGSIVGVLGLCSGDRPRPFREREIRTLERYAQLGSLALDNARLHADAEHELAERARAEAALRVSEERYRRLSDATFEALVVHRDGVVLEVNQAFTTLFGYEAAEIVGRPFLEIAAPEARLLAGEYLRHESEVPLEAAARFCDGTTFPAELMSRTIEHVDGEPARVTAFRDIRERKSFEERLSRQALYDSLTDLANRDLLTDRLERTLTWGERFSDPIAVLLLDLDRFKVVNESLGHAAGDQLLVAVARRLADCVRPADTVARFSGDAFAILVDGVSGPDEAIRIAERIEGEFETPFAVEGREWFLSASIGIVLGTPGEPGPGTTHAGDMLRDAEIALYRAKADTTAAHAVFEPSMNALPLERFDLETDLRRALARDELQVHYQPIVDLVNGRIVGHEALVRWEHPQRGLLAPDSFVPLAEETGLIVPIGLWVIETACRQTRAWQERFPSDPPLLISVNLSTRQFSQPDLVAQIAGILAQTGLRPTSLELEITESVVMGESESTVSSLRGIHALGVRLALDDFGTGYSSLSYLKRLPLSNIKIDRAFVSRLDHESRDIPIVRAVVSLAHGLGIAVTVEGIERAEELAVLRDLDCDGGQGFFFAPPGPAATIERLLAGGHLPARP